MIDALFVWLAVTFAGALGYLVGAYVHRARFRKELETYAREIDALRVDSAKLWMLGRELQRNQQALCIFDDEVRH